MHLLHVARALEKARDDSGRARIEVGFVIFGQGIVGFVMYAWSETFVMHLVHVARALEEAMHLVHVARALEEATSRNVDNLSCGGMGVLSKRPRGGCARALEETMDLVHVARALEEATSRNVDNLSCGGMGVLSKRPRGGCALERAEQNFFTCSTIARVPRRPWDTKATMQRQPDRREQIGRRRCCAL